MRFWLTVKTLLVRLEAPTWGLAIVIHGGWLALTLCWNRLPPPLVLLSGAWLCAWHMSLQHEIIHGHPTRNPRINGMLAALPIGLWLPFGLYREQHLRHHRHAHLTDPLEDPESTYLSPEAWAAAPAWRRRLQVLCNTLPGRMLFGPALAIWSLWAAQGRLLLRGELRWRFWLGHAAGAALVLGWVVAVCRIDPLAYLLLVAYPGTALSMIRSLAEHRAASEPGDRTAVVERAGLLGLLFLHNNLHVLHHERPALPWFALPGAWRAGRAELLRNRRIPVYRGYREVAARFALRPHHPGPYPLLPGTGSRGSDAVAQAPQVPEAVGG